jgi:DNA-binding transcriptional ArsR family regulator
MQGNYYAIIPAKVRHDKNLKPIAKLLFAEITALSNAKGYAYPTNAYLGEIYEVSNRTITSHLKQLEDNGYIKIVIERNSKGSNKKGTYRYIYPLMDMSSDFTGGGNELLEGVKEISNGGEGDFHTKEYYKNNTINKYYKKKREKKENSPSKDYEVTESLSTLATVKNKEEAKKEKVAQKRKKVGIPSPNYPPEYSQELITACEAYFEHRKQIGSPFSSKNAKQTKVLQTTAQVGEYGESKVIASFYEAITEGWKMNYVRKDKKTNKHGKQTSSKRGNESLSIEELFNLIDEGSSESSF